jgi:hypothetical protein
MTSHTNLSRRAAANIAAWRQGIPTTQAGVDKMWTGVVGKLNATIPASRSPVDLSSPARTSAAGPERPLERAVDWAAISGSLNREAGLAAPARSRAR